MRALAYSDDVVLLCHTKTGLLKMLNNVNNFLVNVILFSMLTNQLIVYSNIQTSVNNINITFQCK